MIAQVKFYFRKIFNKLNPYLLGFLALVVAAALLWNFFDGQRTSEKSEATYSEKKKSK